MCATTRAPDFREHGNVPIPGENVSLNASDLLSQAKAEQDALRDELKTQLDEMTYNKLLATDKEMVTNAKAIVNATYAFDPDNFHGGAPVKAPAPVDNEATNRQDCQFAAADSKSGYGPEEVQVEAWWYRQSVFFWVF